MYLVFVVVSGTGISGVMECLLYANNMPGAWGLGGCRVGLDSESPSQ